MEYEEMRRMEKTHCCAQCGGLLVARWLADAKCHELVCRYDPLHLGVQRIPTLDDALARGEADKHLGEEK